MLISFSGLDGSGKSTLIRALKERLEAEGHPVAVIRMYDHVGLYPLLRFARNQIFRRAVRFVRRTPDGPPMSTDPDRLGGGAETRGRAARFALGVVRSATMKRAVYRLDVIAFSFYRFYFERLRKRVLIIDRYFFDTAADLAGAISEAELAHLLAIPSRPERPIFVDVSPETAFARKGEYSVSYNARRREFYRRIFLTVPTVTVIANDDLAASLREIDRIAIGIPRHRDPVAETHDRGRA